MPKPIANGLLYQSHTPTFVATLPNVLVHELVIMRLHNLGIGWNLALVRDADKEVPNSMF